MERDYFVKSEKIHKKRGGQDMVIMDIKADNLYSFKNFHLNMSYPKKIVDSTINQEYLEDRPNFRYRKVNIIMGGNATGKTSLGKLLMLFLNYFTDGTYKRFTNIIHDTSKTAQLIIDFVTALNVLYRFELKIEPMHDNYSEENVHINFYYTPINVKDNYEMCAKRIDEADCYETTYDKINTSGWHFSYPKDAWTDKKKIDFVDNDKYLHVLEQVLKTLDTSIKEVIKVKELDNTYAIKYDRYSVLIKDGEITNAEYLSSGTKAGIDIAYTLTALICDWHDFYYCDERFSYVNSDVEKACLSIMIDKLVGRKQLFFTTHNTDVLDMQLPKHSFIFLKKDINNSENPIKCINASYYLKRNTDSLKHAVENDLFCTVPELSLIHI